MDVGHVPVGVNYLSWLGWIAWLQPTPLELNTKTSICIMESRPDCSVEVVQSSWCSIDIQIDYFNYQNIFSRIEWNIWKWISKGHLKLIQTTHQALHLEKHFAAHVTLSLLYQSTQLEPGKTTTRLHCSLCSHESLSKLTWYSS